jgi:hypothetical protein
MLSSRLKFSKNPDHAVVFVVTAAFGAAAFVVGFFFVGIIFCIVYKGLFWI